MADKRILRKTPKNSHKGCFIISEWNCYAEKGNVLKNMPDITVVTLTFVLEASLWRSLESSAVMSERLDISFDKQLHYDVFRIHLDLINKTLKERSEFIGVPVKGKKTLFNWRFRIVKALLPDKLYDILFKAIFLDRFWVITVCFFGSAGISMIRRKRRS